MAGMRAGNYRSRLAGAADVERVRAIVFATLREHDLLVESGKTDADIADLDAAYFARGGLFRVVLDEAGAITGTGGVHALTDSACELRKMYLLPQARGRGFGRCLLEELIEDARRLGFSTMQLETASVLARAIALYRERGFERVSLQACSGGCDQVWTLPLS